MFFGLCRSKLPNADSHGQASNLPAAYICNGSAARAAASDAWQRLGRLFLDRGLGCVFNGKPWALQQFGEPETCQ